MCYRKNITKQCIAVFSALIFILSVTSCEKVIRVKLSDADKKIVIDAVLTDQEGGCIVRVSQTKKFDDDNTFNGLSGAQVSIRDSAGNIITLTEDTPGIYKNTILKGIPGIEYGLTVAIDGQTFTSTSIMPEPVHLDSIYVKTQRFFDEDETFANVVFNDPAITRNYYRFVQYINDKRSKGTFIMDDDLSDGKLFNSTLYFFPDTDEEKIKQGDVVTVEMQCLNAAVYKYWYSFDQGASGSSQSAAPSNPVSNIEGGALGCFSTHTVSSLTVTMH